MVIGFMVEVYKDAVYLSKGREIIKDTAENKEKILSIAPNANPEYARLKTMAAQVLLAHNRQKQSDPAVLSRDLQLNFDLLASHDITYVNIIQTAKASGLEDFPLPYILTNCHNSLAAVGGTINADDHCFGLSAARRYGAIYVPPHLAVIHSYIREVFAAPGKMILGSDSHTRYGSLGTLGVGEGGGELVKQLLSQAYDISFPKIIAVYLSGKPRPGVGPQDVALAIIGAVFNDGFAKNAVLEFVGSGISCLSADFRASLDIMTTETACWSSVWETDDICEQYLSIHHRDEEYKKMSPGDLAFYDGLINVDLSKIKPMIALPFHPSNVFEIDVLLENPGDILRQTEKQAKEVLDNKDISLDLTKRITKKGLRVDQGIIAGCAVGTFDNIMAARNLIGAHGCRGGLDNEGFSLSVYPGSQPIHLELTNNGAISSLLAQGIIVRSAFCGPCFGAGDVPVNKGLSIRHVTRNFPNREGSKPNQGQISSVCLMDSRSIAATALNSGYLASAESLGRPDALTSYYFNSTPYSSRVYNGAGKPLKNAELQYGPNITDWPHMDSLGKNLLLKIVAFINDPVTTTDELIPSGETSSFRSNPLGLAEFTLSRKDPSYVGRAKAVQDKNLAELPGIVSALKACISFNENELQLCSAIFARRPGDGSAREQAASCQRVLGGRANFAHDYATKRYRSNLINWGILPFILKEEPQFTNGDYVFIPEIDKAVRENALTLNAFIVSGTSAGDNPKAEAFALDMPELNDKERELILAGSLINLNKKALV